MLKIFKNIFILSLAIISPIGHAMEYDDQFGIARAEEALNIFPEAFSEIYLRSSDEIQKVEHFFSENNPVFNYNNNVAIQNIFIPAAYSISPYSDNQVSNYNYQVGEVRKREEEPFIPNKKQCIDQKTINVNHVIEQPRQMIIPSPSYNYSLQHDSILRNLTHEESNPQSLVVEQEENNSSYQLAHYAVASVISIPNNNSASLPRIGSKENELFIKNLINSRKAQSSKKCCNKKHDTWASLIHHVRTKHLDLDNQGYKCPYPGCTKHMRVYSVPQQAAERLVSHEMKDFSKCVRCGKLLASIGYLKSHFLNCGQMVIKNLSDGFIMYKPK